MKILIVDDDHDLLEALTLGMQLQWQGTEVLTAGDGETALELFFEQAPDVVLLDVGLPKVDGFEVLRRIRQVSDAPVLMLTARGEELDKVRGLEIGADDYVTKPFSPLRGSKPSSAVPSCRRRSVRHHRSSRAIWRSTSTPAKCGSAASSSR
jgi:two-component system, OmpR family, response regulator